MSTVSNWPPASGTPERPLIEELAQIATANQLQLFGVEFFQLCTRKDLLTSLRTLFGWERQGFVFRKLQVQCTKCLRIYPRLLTEIENRDELECPYCWDESKDQPTVFAPTPEDSYLLFGFTEEAIEGIMEVKRVSLIDSASIVDVSMMKPHSEAELLASFEIEFTEAHELRDIPRMADAVAMMENLKTCDALSRAVELRQRFPHLNT